MHTANGSNAIMLGATGYGGVAVITITLAVGLPAAGRILGVSWWDLARQMQRRQPLFIEHGGRK